MTLLQSLACLPYFNSRTLHEKTLCKMSIVLVIKESKSNENESFSVECLEHFKNTTDFVCRFLMMDETWVHQYMPEIKIQSKQ